MRPIILRSLLIAATPYHPYASPAAAILSLSLSLSLSHTHSSLFAFSFSLFACYFFWFASYTTPLHPIPPLRFPFFHFLVV